MHILVVGNLSFLFPLFLCNGMGFPCVTKATSETNERGFFFYVPFSSSQSTDFVNCLINVQQTQLLARSTLGKIYRCIFIPTFVCCENLCLLHNWEGFWLCCCVGVPNLNKKKMWVIFFRNGNCSVMSYAHNWHFIIFNTFKLIF